MAQGSIHGRFVWQELMTEDTAAAATFYSKVVGWHAQPSAADPSYTQFGIGSGYYAGMMRVPEEARAMGAKPQWLPYIGVADVEATAVSAERVGGHVKKPGTDIPTIGRYAILSDPQGGTFAIFKPAQGNMGAGAGETTPLGGFSWLELATTDQEAAIEFYGKLFGWQAVQRMDMGPQGTYLIFGHEGAQRGGMYKLHSDRSPVPYWLPYASVPSADAAATVATAAGGRFVVGPMDVPGGGRIVQIIDPSGAMFAVHSVAAAKPAAPSKPAAKPAAAKPAAPSKPAVKPAAAKPAAPKPAPAQPAPAKPAPAKPAPAKAPAAPSKPASASPATKKPAAKKAAAKKAAPKKAAKKAAAKKKPAAKKKAAKKASGRKSAAKSAKKSARKATKKSARKSGGGKRQPAKARRKK
jgi:predicted enzyme related to lactoylglutathione lyase